MAFHYSPRIVKDGLVLYLDGANTRSYSGTGSTWYDLVGDNNGSINGPVFDTANFGGFVFDGIDDVVTIPAINLGDFTISQVINLSTNINSGDMTIGGGDYAGGPTYWGYIWFLNTGGVILAVNGEVGIVFTVSNSVWVNKTIYYTVTRSGTDAKIYINGVLFDTQSIVTDDFTIRAIGRSYDPYYTTSGTIYSTKIYDRSLSQQEITQNYNAIKSRYDI